MISEHAVHKAELAIAERKLAITAQWAALRGRAVDKVTSPTALAGIAFAGAVLGWRSGAPPEKTSSGNAKSEPSGSAPLAMLDSAARSLGVGLLRGIATMAVEELMRNGGRVSERPAAGVEPSRHQ